MSNGTIPSFRLVAERRRLRPPAAPGRLRRRLDPTNLFSGFIDRIYSKGSLNRYIQRVNSPDLFKGFTYRILSTDLFNDFIQRIYGL